MLTCNGGELDYLTINSIIAKLKTKKRFIVVWTMVTRVVGGFCYSTSFSNARRIKCEATKRGPCYISGIFWKIPEVLTREGHEKDGEKVFPAQKR